MHIDFVMCNNRSIPYFNKTGPLIVKNDLDSIKGDHNLNEKVFLKAVKLKVQ